MSLSKSYFKERTFIIKWPLTGELWQYTGTTRACAHFIEKMRGYGESRIEIQVYLFSDKYKLKRLDRLFWQKNIRDMKSELGKNS